MSLSIVRDEVQNRVGACAELEIRAGHVFAPQPSDSDFLLEHNYMSRGRTGNKLVLRAHECHEVCGRHSARRQTTYIMR